MQCSYYVGRQVFRAGVEPSWMIHHARTLCTCVENGLSTDLCLCVNVGIASDLVVEASFTDSLVARLNIGKPIMLASDASSWFAYEQFYVQFSRINRVGRSKKIVCG